MKPLVLFTFFLALGSAFPANAQDNPFKNSKIGDWVEYRLVTKGSDVTIEGKIRMVVSVKNEKNLVMKVTTRIKETESTHELVIDLTKPFDVAQSPLPEPNQKSDTKVEKLKEGKETIQVANREFACSTIQSKVTGKHRDIPFESVVTAWVAKDAPLSGLVKLEVKSKFSDMTMTIASFGQATK